MHGGAYTTAVDAIDEEGTGRRDRRAVTGAEDGKEVIRGEVRLQNVPLPS